MTEPIGPVSAWPGLEVAIEGTNLSPEDIDARHTIELVEAAISALEAIAKDRGSKSVGFRFVGIHKGSAAYDLRVPDPASVPIIEELARHVEKRGTESSPGVRRAIERLHRAGKGAGSVRLRVYDSKGVARSKPLYVAAPLNVVYAPFDTTTEVYGRVVAVAAGRGDRLSVKLRLDDGGTAEFEADNEVAAIAGRLFLRTVRAEVDYEVTVDGESATEIRALQPFDPAPDDEILGAFDEARAQLAKEGFRPRASDWLKELDE